MNFFERFPAPEPPPDPEPQPDPPAWIKPEAVLGGTVPAELVLARGSDAVVAVSGLIAYPNGFSFTVTAVLRREDRRGRVMRLAFHHDFMDESPPDPEFLRVGIQFADGSAASNLGSDGPLRRDETPTGPLLMRDSGGGGGRRYDLTFFVWPLPPPGPLTFVCEWPAHGIPETGGAVDARLLLDAAARAVPLWPSAAG